MDPEKGVAAGEAVAAGNTVAEPGAGEGVPGVGPPTVQTMVPAPPGWAAVLEVGGKPMFRDVAAWVMLDTHDGVPAPAGLVAGVGPLRFPEAMENFLGYRSPSKSEGIPWDRVALDAALMRGRRLLGPVKWDVLDAEGGAAEPGKEVRWVGAGKGVNVFVDPVEQPGKNGLAFQWRAECPGVAASSGRSKDAAEARALAVEVAAGLLAGVRLERRPR